MELVCNELSFFPLANDKHIAEKRFETILRTFKEARQKYGFTHIRFPLNYSAQKITLSQTLFEWVSTISNHSLKSLIVGIFKSPYIDDLDELEVNFFLESTYSLSEENSPVNNSPFGLPIAYIKSVPSISFDSHFFWRNKKIQVVKSEKHKPENSLFHVHNICLSSDLDSNELNEWRELSFPKFLKTEVHLRNYLGYIKYKSVFRPAFLEQLYDWKHNDFEVFKHLLLLMKDVESYPFSGGRGQTENLKNRGKEASKRINIKDRLSYSISDDVVTFIACKGHYQFHNQ